MWLNHRGQTGREGLKICNNAPSLLVHKRFFHCWSLPISSQPISSCFVYLSTFISVWIQAFSPCLAWEKWLGMDRRKRVPQWWNIRMCFGVPGVLHIYLENLCTSNICAILFVFSICIASWVYHVVGVVITVDPQLHNRDLLPTQSLKLHRGDTCDLWYLRPPSQLLGAEMKQLETETLFFPFGVKRKCGNKRQRAREGKHAQQWEEKKTAKQFVSWPNI